jgi:hypothetical protein
MVSRLPETSPFPIMRHVGKSPVTQRLDKRGTEAAPSPPLRFFHFQHSLSLYTHNRSSQKWPVGRIKTSSPGTSCCPGSRVPHNQRRGWGYLSRRIWMKLDESGLLNAKMSNGPRNDGLIVRIAMRVAVFLNIPTRSFDTPHATGCVSKVDCGNSIVSLDRTNKRSTRFVAIWTGSAGLSPATNATVRQSLSKLFKYIRVKRLAALKIADVDRFLIQLAKQGWTCRGICSIAHPASRVFPLRRADELDEARDGSLDSWPSGLSAGTAAGSLSPTSSDF